MFTVSIVIPTYNRPALLAEAIRSCLDQTYPPSELIVGDDSPGDESRQVVEAMQVTTSIPIRHIHNKPSLRQVANVNRLFDAATGDKTMLLHDDDLLLPEALETLVNVFRKHDKVAVAFGKQYLIDQTGQIDYASSEIFNRDFYRIPPYEGVNMTPFEAGISQQFPNNGYLIDTAIIRQIQYTNESGDACDFDFGYRIGAAGHRTYFVDSYLGKYRLHNQSISHSRASNPAYHAYKLLVEAAPETQLGKSIRAIRLRERAPIAITEALLMGDRRQAMSILFGPWYRSRLLTPRGIKRVLHTVFNIRFDRPQSTPATH
ncbi:glycosyltransferase family 2 protein [Spirosoma rhododendri]|uniref:Glycosyltransferase family 2 protein n=1 Tax=Spirosoma rhododendri TaxID=2728024 RepID=A0A7L5DS99_9BACT|nr:glycosyltransferase [Spirosoma rhododendri]QJD80123.1 glycosyltransferase family 2 protein [Spirosoma rhododendri]